MGLVINFPQDYLASELAALMINLSYNARNVEQMIANKGLNLLMDRLAVIIIMFIMLVHDNDDDRNYDDNYNSFNTYQHILKIYRWKKYFLRY